MFNNIVYMYTVACIIACTCIKLLKNVVHVYVYVFVSVPTCTPLFHKSYYTFRVLY